MNTARALQELALQPGATEEEIRDAYRQLVATWHPDKYQNNPAKLHEAELRIKNINAAFEKLQANNFRTERTSRKASSGSKTASSTSTEDRKILSKQLEARRLNPVRGLFTRVLICDLPHG